MVEIFVQSYKIFDEIQAFFKKSFKDVTSR